MIALGEKSIYGQILKEINLRDKTDKSRKESPLIKPARAIIIDNSNNFQKTIIPTNSGPKIRDSKKEKSELTVKNSIYMLKFSS